MKRTPLRRRSGLRSRTPLRTWTPLRRRSRIRPANPEQKAKLHREQFGEHAKWVRTLPCCIAQPNHIGPVDPAHVKSRGAGGTCRDVVPMCRGHHQEQHRIGIETFEDRYRINLSSVAEMLWEQRKRIR